MKFPESVLGVFSGRLPAKPCPIQGRPKPLRHISIWMELALPPRMGRVAPLLRLCPVLILTD